MLFTETPQAYLYNACKKVVDNGVKESVKQDAPWHVGDALQFPINEELGCHEYKAANK